MVDYVDLKREKFNPLILVNSENKLPEDYDGKIIEHDGYQISSYIFNDLMKMIQAAKNMGVILVVNSAYRSYKEQKEIFERRINELGKNGTDYNRAYEEVKKSVSLPGYSEHETGLAIDFSINDGEQNKRMWAWLRQNAQEYGFVLRYPQNKEQITKISYEAWHYRYVGIDVAREMKEKDLCLEEYWEQIKLENVNVEEN